MELTKDISIIRQVLEKVTDPEIPVLTIHDLGVLRNIHWEEDQLIITITPTYSGCPAMGVIEADIKKALAQEGYDNVLVKTILSPAWTTDWLTEEGRHKLEVYGIAPPLHASYDKKILLGVQTHIRCPLCKSENVQMLSQFGSTACKSLYKCNDCLEPFDYFKCI